MLSTLSMRLVALIAMVTLAGMGVLAWVVVEKHAADLEHETVQGALWLSSTLERSVRGWMRANRKDELYRALGSVSQQSGIERLRLLNKSGRITYSSLPAEQGQTVDMQAEACTQCHSGTEPAVRLDDRRLTRIFAAADGHRVLGLITPIYTEPSCSAAGCHPPPSQRNVLGVMDMQLSLAGMDQAIEEQNRSLLYSTYLLMLLIASVSGVFVWRFVHRPVNALIRGMERIRAGDLKHQIVLRSRTEIGLLAASFNDMTRELEQAQQQLKDWTRTLEQRVDEKTRNLQQAQARLVHNEKMASLGTLAAVVAHEINNPLSGVLTYAKLVRRMVGTTGPKPDRVESIQKYLKTMETETARCGNIVRNLLEFSRQSGAVTGEVDINEILDRTLFLIAHKLELQGISLHKAFADSVPVLSGDADQLQQAMLAVLINAVEAMPDGGDLRVTTSLLGDGSSRQVQVEIQDSGPGIPQDALDRLFEPFYTTKQDKKGVGLGLSVVYGIVRRHNGRIDVRSEPGKGATFVVTLPERTPVEEELLSGPEEGEDRAGD
ncbi:MAG: ATP-binding protein [Candidatus Latescibacterota bacterium]